MMSIAKPNKPYIMLETIPGKSEGKDEKCLHMISADESAAVKLGRGHNSEIRISDISVSRVHAEIQYKNSKYYLHDKGSKFGTLVQVKEDILLNEGLSHLKMQFGRSVVEMALNDVPAVEVDTE